jgi:tRNA modification GTPase
MANTIIALATPFGRSGIGVIRLSGQDALAYALRLSGDSELDLEPRLVRLTSLRDPETAEVIDEALLTYFKAPHSFTGENVIEISCHGSPVLLRQVIDICLRFGARMAEPGEFTLRALANGRMNLAEAEAVRDLIDAQTTASARQAVRQLRGEFSNTLQPIKDKLLDLIVVLESAIEFVEDDLPEFQTDLIKTRLAELSDEIGKLAETFQAGKLIREGLRVALVGRPNVGKSSLFNALLGTDRAIVTEIAGTTRDQIHEKFTINNIPISLMDTAGLRETTDTVESIGVERSRMAMADADLVVVLLDGSEELSEEDKAIIASIEGLNNLLVINKTDKISVERAEDLSRDLSSAFRIPHTAIVKVSAKTDFGLDNLKQAIVQPFAPQDISNSGFLVTDARHHDLLVRSKNEIVSSLSLFEQKTSEEIVLVGLHNALRYLGQITGETTTEDMLTRIFATFCIGK